MSTIGKEDIYESDGASSQVQNTQPENDAPNHPDIELVSVDIDEALKKYKNRVLNLTSIDYSDSIAKKRRHAFGNNQYVLEVAGAGFAGTETAAEKLNRILYEIADLNEQLRTDENVKTDLLNAEVLENLEKEVKTLQGVQANGKPARVEHEVELPKVRSDSKVATLENRLRRIEQVIGSSVIPSAPVLDTIEDLKLRCETLNQSYVSGLEQRLNVMLTKLEKIDETRANNDIDENLDKKVNEILELMQKWDVACSSLPSNVNKVKALNRLHEQAQHFAGGLSHLKTIREKLEKEVAQGREAIIEYETNGKQEIGSVVEKLKILEAKVAELK
ncbi:CRE-DNC-2 protein [Caenorhabditis remanei]|uniref:CRE-DNC-2 protein n=1 Tax=Caenorhabditis remanei TaxID=31234 RepID=E3LYR2_CAERE|nr:CRE-DNC-2 protein [Caenorhabditis remanei]